MSRTHYTALIKGELKPGEVFLARRAQVISLRVPAHIHDELDRKAAELGISRNALMTRILADALGMDMPKFRAWMQREPLKADEGLSHGA